MRQETNNEIDLLLRRMGRQDGGSVSEAHEQHLDVDELSLYAQNALPAAARTRYTEHLVECSTCRKLVTELSLSFGETAAAAARVQTVGEPSALKKFLASLFSPMVLRYAVPALGLIVVGVIGFVILREGGRNDFVAQVETKQSQSAPLTATPEASAPASSPDATARGYVHTDRSREIADPKEAEPKSGVSSGIVAGTGPAPAPAPTPARDEKTAPAPEGRFTAEPPPVAKAAPATESEERKKEEQKKKDEAAKNESAVTVQSTDTTVSTARANEPVRGNDRAPQPGAQRVDESKREAVPAQGRSITDSVSTLRTRPQKAQKGNDDAETRTVSGRRFRKERGIWTDTAYDSSTATVNMTRGSEQFRALVADEPEIKKIAEQLDGEVIVVWKGRAYRIR